MDHWELIIEHLTLAQQCDRSGYYHFDNFVDTLQGFIDINGTVVTSDQWHSITEKLQGCFKKVTSTMEDLGQGIPGISPEDMGTILRDVVRTHETTKPFHNPLTPDIICGPGSLGDPTEGMPTSTCHDSKAFCAKVEEVACCGNLDNVQDDKFKDIISTEYGFSYTVYISYCRECGKVNEDGTWIE